MSKNKTDYMKQRKDLFNKVYNNEISSTDLIEMLIETKVQRDENRKLMVKFRTELCKYIEAVSNVKKQLTNLKKLK